LRRNDTDGRKIPFLVIPVKTGIHFQKPHKKPVNKKVQKYRKKTFELVMRENLPMSSSPLKT
ncbi:MAG: hypothetical protein SFH39_11815, partial [Candidatus Magnetobacterium sp. LHC-1]